MDIQLILIIAIIIIIVILLNKIIKDIKYKNLKKEYTIRHYQNKAKSFSHSFNDESLKSFCKNNLGSSNNEQMLGYKRELDLREYRKEMFRKGMNMDQVKSVEYYIDPCSAHSRPFCRNEEDWKVVSNAVNEFQSRNNPTDNSNSIKILKIFIGIMIISIISIIIYHI